MSSINGTCLAGLVLAGFQDTHVIFYPSKEHSLGNEMKNWGQFLFGPVFAMDKMPRPVDASR